MNALKITYDVGWYPEERTERGPFRWMKKKAKFKLIGLPTKGQRELLIVGGHAFHKKTNPKLRVYTNNTFLGEREVFPGLRTYPFQITNCNDEVEIYLELDRTFNSDLKEDRRKLGIVIEEIKVHSKQMPSFPIFLEIETSTFCNINPPCVMCYPRIFDKRQYKGDIDISTFQKLIPYLKKFRTISLFGVGEPLLGKDLLTILDAIDTNKTKTQFNSNGLLLTEEMSRKLIEKRLKLIDFSLDAATSKTYKKIRRSDFSLVIENIKRLAKIKKELGVKHPVIELNMTLMKENLSEVVSFIEMAKRLEAETVHLGLLNPFREYQVENEGFIFSYKEQMIDINSEVFRKTIKKAKQKAEELGVELILEFSKYYS